MRNELYDMNEEILKLGVDEDNNAMDTKKISILLGEIEKTLRGHVERIVEDQVFESFRNLFRVFQKSENLFKKRMTDLITISFQSFVRKEQLERSIRMKGLQCYLLLSHMFFLRVDRMKEEKITRDLSNQKNRLMAIYLEICEKHAAVFNEGTQNQVVETIIKGVGCLIDIPENLKNNELRNLTKKVLCFAITNHFFIDRIVSIIMQSFGLFEHQTTYYAELVYMLRTDFNDSNLTEKLLCEIGGTVFSSEGQTQKTVSDFLHSLCDISEEIIFRNMSFLLLQLESESHYIRGAVVSIIHAAIRHLKKQPAEKNTATQIEPLFSVLDERLYDTIAYVRTKAIGVYTNLCKERAISISKRKNLIELVSERLEDKSSTVRKKAIEFFITLLQTHPFYLDGGELSISFLTNKLNLIEKYIKEHSLKKENENIQAEERKNNQMEMLNTQLIYYKDSIDFSNRIGTVVPVIGAQLGSEVKTEVIDAIDFVVCSFLYQITKADLFIKKVFHLVWIQDSPNKEDGGVRGSIKEHVVSSFISLFLEQEKGEEGNAVESLLELVSNKTKAEISSIEKILSIAIKKYKKYSFLEDSFWNVIREKNCSLERRRNAFVLLSIVTKDNPDSIEENLDVIVHFAFDRKEELCEHSALILQRLCKNRSKLESTNRLFERIDCFVKEAEEKDFPAIEQFIKAVYLICNTPEAFMCAIIKELLGSYFKTEKKTTTALNKILFVSSSVSLQQIIRLEESEEAFKKETGKRKNEEEENEDEEKQKMLSSVKDHGLLYGKKSILSVIAGMAICLCQEPQETLSISVQRNAIQTLSRFMCVSPTFCKENISLLKRKIEKSKDPIIRCNLLVSLGDLAVLHNKIIDENISIITERLRDDNNKVRYTALLILSKLTLNDFVKLRGRLGVVAMCLEDKDERIRASTEHLFCEIGKKKDLIYNSLLDIVSELSSVACEESFKRICRFIFSFIKKDTQNEKIIEKICARLKKEDEAKIKYNLSFCLTLLQYNSTKSAKQILDGLISHVSMDDSVYNFFVEIGKKITKIQRVKEVGDEISRFLMKQGENINKEQMQEDAKRLRTSINAGDYVEQMNVK